MAEKTNVPEIRFAGFTDPWEQRKLGDLISVYIAHAEPEEDVTVLTSSRDGIQKQEDHFGRLQQHDTSDWNLIPYGYCTYRNRSDDGLFTFNVNKVADRGIVSKFYPVFETPECDADFLVAYLNSSQEIRRKLFVLAVGTSQVVLSYGALKELSLLLPQNREQSAIANVLNHIDNLITLHQRKYDKLAQLKKSMLDKMFPKPGERFPEIRFAGFTDPWEQRKLGELCTISKGHGYSKADIRDAGTPLILYGRLYTQYESRIENVNTFAVEQEGSLLSKGNEVIVPASGETAEDIAVASSVRSSGIIFGGDLNVVTPVSKLDPDYTALAITYSKAHDDLAKRAQGKSVVHVHGNDIAEVEIPYPSESEQKRISTVVLGLDSLITLHQRKLELLRNTKKSLLDRMFV